MINIEIKDHQVKQVTSLVIDSIDKDMRLLLVELIETMRDRELRELALIDALGRRQTREMETLELVERGTQCFVTHIEEAWHEAEDACHEAQERIEELEQRQNFGWRSLFGLL